MSFFTFIPINKRGTVALFTLYYTLFFIRSALSDTALEEDRVKIAPASIEQNGDGEFALASWLYVIHRFY